MSETKRHSDVIEIPLDQLKGYPKNPRKITQEGLNRLCESIRLNGYWRHRPAAVEKNEDGKFVVLDGNQRLKALRRMKRKTMPCYVYENLTEDERTDIILRSNVNNGEWDADALRIDYADVDFAGIGIDIKLPDLFAKEPEEPTEPEDEPEQEEQAPQIDILDILFPSDNDFEIPTLDLNYQGGKLELPLLAWGAMSRVKAKAATYHFYVDDYRFEKLWKDPSNLLASGCKAIIEHNCSMHDQTPVAYGLQQIYKKRWLARYCQEVGIRVYVDLNVAPKFAEYNKLGVPKGWDAFFTRGTTGRADLLAVDFQAACEISGKDTPNLIVYGGGKDVQEFCKEHNLLFIKDFIHTKNI